MSAHALRVRRYDLHMLNLRTRMPFGYGIASLTCCPHLFASVELEIDGRPHRGLAAENLAPKWFTKDATRTYADDVADMLAVIRAAFDFAVEAGPANSVFDLWWRVYSQQKIWGAQHGFPALLLGLGTSLVERAVIDAFCRGAGVNFATAARPNLLGLDLGRLGRPRDSATLMDALPSRPLRSIIARHTVGLSDPLTEGEIAPSQRVNDGLPQSLEQCIRTYGLTHFKIKLSGDELRDLERLHQLARIIPVATDGRFAVTLDANENFRQIASFQSFWQSLRADASLTPLLANLLFVEQPLHRDVALSDEVANALRAWPAHPPIIIDESDADFESFPRALACGYTGTSHKNCKGIFKGLANACQVAAFRRTHPATPCLLSGEDLSNVGPCALLQDLAVMATLGIPHVERNGHHYFAGLTALPAPVQAQVLAHHGDLYHRHANGLVAVKINAGNIAVGSIVDAPFGMAFDLDPTIFTPLDQWAVASLSASA